MKYLNNIIALTLLVICTVVNIGCKKNESTNNYQYEKEDMTTRDEELLRSCGLEEKQIDYIRKNGLNSGQIKFIKVAKNIIKYLEKKYGETFEIVYANVVGFETDSYAITAEATSGIYAFKEFNTYYEEDKGYSDEYFNLCMAERAGQAATNLLSNEYDNVKVIAKLSYYYSEDYDINMSDDDLLHKCDFTFFVLFYGPYTNENDFKEISKNIEDCLNKNKIHFDGQTYCFKINLDYVNNYEQFCEINDSLGRENIYLYEENITES